MTKTVQLFNYSTIQRQRGTALIITLLVISLVAAMAFGMAKLSLSEIRQVARAQDSIAAYFAAEAGLEDGLMRYKALGKNTIVPTDGSNQVQRVNIATKEAPNDGSLLTAPTVVPPTNPPSDQSKYWYDLKMSYLTNQIGAVDGFKNVITSQSPQLNRDETREVDLRALASADNSARIYWSTPKKAGADVPAQKNIGGVWYDLQLMMQMTLTTKSGTEFLPFKGSDYRVAPPNTTAPPQDHIALRFKPYIFYQVGDDKTTRRTTDEGGNLLTELVGSYVHYAILPDPANVQNSIDSGTTTITSTGYYGDTKRTLQVKINRQTNTLIGLFDFTLYQGTGELGSN